MQRHKAGILAVLAAGAVVSIAPTRLSAQALQLPSIHYFATDSSVLVPDQGRVALGRFNSATSGSSQFGGLPGNRARGGAVQASSATVSAFVHDFEAWEQALLARAAKQREGKLRAAGAAAGDQTVRRRPTSGAAADSGAANSDVVTGDALAGLASVSEIEHARQAAAAQAAGEIDDLFSRARRAQHDGKPRLARTYYQMVARRADGELKQQALSQLAALNAALAKPALIKPAPAVGR